MSRGSLARTCARVRTRATQSTNPVAAWSWVAVYIVLVVYGLVMYGADWSRRRDYWQRMDR